MAFEVEGGRGMKQLELAPEGVTKLASVRSQP